jgi:tetratricopeptide (TPR) repeat protein
MYILAAISGLYLMLSPLPTVLEALKTFTYPPQQIKHMTFGYHESVSDSMWLRVIQDIDVCEKKDQNSALRTEGGVCRKAWVYQYLDAITELTPQFRMPFATGPLILSVVVEDREGATQLFEKALRQFPNDWPIIYRAAYHFMYEEKDEARAAQLLLRAADLGAPPWLRSLAAKLLTQSGKLELARSVIKQAMESNPNEKLRERLEQRLREIEDAETKSQNQ